MNKLTFEISYKKHVYITSYTYLLVNLFQSVFFLIEIKHLLQNFCSKKEKFIFFKGQIPVQLNFNPRRNEDTVENKENYYMEY